MGKDNGGAGFIGNGILGGVDFLRNNLGHPRDLGQKARDFADSYKDNSMTAINEIKNRGREFADSYKDNSMVAINEIKNRARESYNNNFDTSTQEIPVMTNKVIDNSKGLGLTNYKDFVVNTPLGIKIPENTQKMVYTATGSAMPNVYGSNIDYNKVVTENKDYMYDPNAFSTVVSQPNYPDSKSVYIPKEDGLSGEIIPRNNLPQNNLPYEEEGLYDRARKYLDGMTDNQKLILGLGTAGVGALGAGLYFGNKNKNKNDGGNLKMAGMDYGRIKKAAALGNQEAMEYVTKVEGLGIDYLVKQAALGNAEADNILNGIDIAFGAGTVKQAHLEELGITKEAGYEDYLPGGMFGTGGHIPGNQFREATRQLTPTSTDDVGYDISGQSMAGMVPNGSILGRMQENYDNGYNPNGQSMAGMIPEAAELESNNPGLMEQALTAMRNHPYAAGAAALGAGALGYGAYRAVRPKTASFNQQEVQAIEMAARLLSEDERQTKVARLAQDPKVAEIAGMILRGEIR